MEISWGLAAVFGSAFVIGFSGALMPGPMFALVLSGSSKSGFKAGPLTVLGHGILELILVIALVLGLGTFLQNETVFKYIGIIGGGVLVYLGIDMIRSMRRVSIDIKKKDNIPGKSLVFHGIIASLSNPYWIMWWATIGMALILSALKYRFWGIAVFFIGHILSDLVWYSSVSFAVDRGRKILSQKVYQGIVATCGVLLVGFGLYFVIGAV
jgi:threonine/homoserine/homoserine lactone efflux protein